MKLAHARTVLLIALVMTSLLLSFVLWQGNWQTSDSVSAPATVGTPVSDTPRITDVAVPYQIVCSTQNSSLSAVGTPSSPLYSDWIKQLSDVHTFGLHSVATSALPNASKVVDYDFGSPLTYRELAHWLPGLPPSPFIKQVKAVKLLQAGDKKPVLLALLTDDTAYVAQTGLSGSEFTQAVTAAVRNNEWMPWNRAAEAYLPAKGVSMNLITYRATLQDVVPFVHTFFLNPQALTHIQAKTTTSLWTDGSRAVWYDQMSHTLTYADPNTPPSTAAADTEDLTALDFIRYHGGAEPDMILFRSDLTDKRVDLTLRPYVDGFPVLGGSGDYEVEVQSGHVLQFKRPVQHLGPRVSDTRVTTLGFDKVTEILMKLMPSELTPSSLQQSISVQLGYYAVPEASDTVQMVPVFYVMQSDLPLWVIDAATGRVIKGMGAQ